MAVHDTIGDFLTTIRNASAAQKETCTVQYSKIRKGIAEILLEDGYIKAVNIVDDGKKLEIKLKYVSQTPAITGLQRHSTPGRRMYYGSQEIPRVLGGLGIAIMTTSKGILRDRDARKQKLGGELLCKVW